MENLILEDTLPGGPLGEQAPLSLGIPPPHNQQLPPQMFTTAAQLLDLTDSKRSRGFEVPSYVRSYLALLNLEGGFHS